MNPLQCCILSISEKTNDYCEELFKQFKKAGMRVEKDLSDKKIQQKIAIHSLEKIPYLLIVGDKEKENNTVSIRIFGKENASPIVMNVSEFINKINEKVINKSLDFEI
jgi:threonyl-tRNA synthetase